MNSVAKVKLGLWWRVVTRWDVALLGGWEHVFCLDHLWSPGTVAPSCVIILHLLDGCLSMREHSDYGLVRLDAYMKD